MTEQVSTNKKENEMIAATVTHLEIPVLKDLQEATAEFYAKTFGWDISYDIMPNYGMTTNTQGKVSIGLPVVEELTPLGDIYVHVEDIDQTLSVVNEFGGKTISEKNKISDDIGFGATFTDPSGNKIGLFSPS